MPRFVILEHADSRGRHWDFMLETGPALATWALSDPPEAGKPTTAQALADHRPAYLDYEGPVSGDRGEVTQWDSGDYVYQRQTEGELAVLLDGRKLQGIATLTQSPDDPRQWRFVFTAETE